MAIPYFDLTAQYKRMQPTLEPRVLAVLASGQYVLGPEIVGCEKELSEFTGSPFSCTVSNGTIALIMALQALDIKPGDEVITTSFSFFATAEAVSILGAKPVFVDIDERTYNMNASLIEAKITPKTKAIMPVSLYGQMADMDAINAIAKKHNLFVIEDAAQSFGAKYKGKRSCTVSTIGCTSFFPAKPLGCAGDGGAVFTANPDMAKRIENIRVHGQTGRYHHEYMGINGRLDPIQCVVIREKLKFYDSDLDRRRAIGSAYTDAFTGLSGIITPYIHPDCVTVYGQYTLQAEDREKFVKDLSSEGIPTSVHYPAGIHEQPVYKKEYAGVKLPITEAMGKRVVSLPLYPDMPKEHVAAVIAAVRKVLS